MKEVAEEGMTVVVTHEMGPLKCAKNTLFGQRDDGAVGLEEDLNPEKKKGTKILPGSKYCKVK